MTQRIVILGGHGKVARLLAPKLTTAGFEVDAVIRNPDQRGDIENAGGHPFVLDMETASIDDFAQLFAGATAIVYSAGAGGGDPKRTRAVDFEAATRTMEAAEQAGVKRYIMVSYARAADHYKDLGADHSFYPYAKDCKSCETQDGKLDHIERDIELHGSLTEDQRRRLLEIADMCPLHRTLTSEINIRTRLA